jgi:hypothetical protein
LGVYTKRVVQQERSGGIEFYGRRSLEASVTTSSLNVEVKECGARVVRDENDASELYQLLKTISPRGLDLPSYDVFASYLRGR